MQTISATALGILESGGVIGLSIACSNGLTITQSHIKQGTFVLDRNSVSGNVIEIGNAETSEIRFTLDNSSGQYNAYSFEGETLTVDFIIGAEALRVGVFTIDVLPEKLKIIEISALDHMVRFNKKFVAPGTGVTTLASLLNYCCTQCLVTLNTTTFTNSTLGFSLPTTETTYHQIIAWIAQIAGANAFIGTNGELYLSWYGENQASTFQITADHRFDYKTEKSKITITGVIYNDGEAETIAGTDTYALVIEGNELILAGDVSDMLTDIYTKIGGYTYLPYKFSTLGLPHLHPLDEISILKPDGITAVDSIITNHQYTLNGRSMVSAQGKTEQQHGYMSAPPLTARQRVIINTIADNKVQESYTSMEAAVLNLNELIANSLGYYTTTLTDGVTGAKTTYIHDASTLETSVVIYVMTGSGFAWTDQGWNGGAPVWQYGITGAGNAILNVLTVLGINAGWLTSGYINVARLAAESITVEKLAVLAKNKVNNYSVTNTSTGWLSLAGGRTVDLYLAGDYLTDKVTTTSDVMMLSDKFDIDPTKSYKLTLSISCSQTTGMRYFGVYVYDKDDVRLNVTPFVVATRAYAAVTNNPYFWYAIGATGGWKHMEGYVMGCNSIEADFPVGLNVINNFKLPANAAKMVVRYLNYSNAGVSSTAYFYSPSVTEVGSGAIVAEQVTAGKLQSADGKTYVDLTNSEIYQSATIGGKTAVFKANPTVGLELVWDSKKVFGVDTSGRIFTNAISNVDSSGYYMTYGYGGSPGLECFAPIGGSTPVKFFGIAPDIGGGFHIVDMNAQIRGDFQANGTTAFYDQNNYARFVMDSGGATYFRDGNGKIRFHMQASGINDILATNGEAVFASNATGSVVELTCATANTQKLGVDATGPYFQKSGTKTYLDQASGTFGTLIVGGDTFIGNAGSARKYFSWGGLYSPGATNTGVIRIALGTMDIMYSLKVTVWSYNYLGEFKFGGYTQTSISAWYKPRALGQVTGGDITVRMSVSGTSRFIEIGDNTTAWGGYLTVTIDEVTGGHGGVLPTTFPVTLETAYAGTANLTKTIVSA